MRANNCRGSKDGGLLEVGGAGARPSYAQSAQLKAFAVARYFVLSRKQAQNLPTTHTHKHIHTHGQIINATYVTQLPLGQQKVVFEFMFLLRRKLLRSLSRISPTLVVPGPDTCTEESIQKPFWTKGLLLFSQCSRRTGCLPFGWSLPRLCGHPTT